MEKGIFAFPYKRLFIPGLKSRGCSLYIHVVPGHTQQKVKMCKGKDLSFCRMC